MPNVQKTWMQRVRIPTELPFLHATVGGWVSITKKRTELPFLHATIGLLGGDPTGQHLRTGPGITNKHLLFFFRGKERNREIHTTFFFSIPIISVHPTNNGIAMGTVSVATTVVVSAGVEN